MEYSAPLRTPRIVIKQGRILDPHNQIDQVADIYIDQGATVAIGDAPPNFQFSEKSVFLSR